jgi:hypothetical protein
MPLMVARSWRRLTGIGTGQPVSRLSGECCVNATGDEAVTLDRDGRARGADSPHMGGAMAGDRDRAAVGGDAVAMRGVTKRANRLGC